MCSLQLPHFPPISRRPQRWFHRRGVHLTLELARPVWRAGRALTAEVLLIASQDMVPIPQSIFHGQKAPDIGIRQFVERIALSSGCSPCCLLMGLMYLDELKQTHPIYALTSINLHRCPNPLLRRPYCCAPTSRLMPCRHPSALAKRKGMAYHTSQTCPDARAPRLVLTSTMVACKFYDDKFYCNSNWGRVGGVGRSHLKNSQSPPLCAFETQPPPPPPSPPRLTPRPPRLPRDERPGA